jgi:hypothetical protein
MVSIVMRIYERTDTNEAHIVVGEGSRSGIGCERAIHSTCLLEGDIPAYRICKMLRFDLERVQRVFLAKGLPGIVRGSQRARPAATVGGARSYNAHRSVKRGRSWQMAGQEIFINESGF